MHSHAVTFKQYFKEMSAKFDHFSKENFNKSIRITLIIAQNRATLAIRQQMYGAIKFIASFRCSSKTFNEFNSNFFMMKKNRELGKKTLTIHYCKRCLNESYQK